MHVVLVHPEIAPNTGNIIRLCANTGVHLHLIEPLGFSLDDRLLRRGGLDYHELADLHVHQSLAAAEDLLRGRWFAFSSAGTIGYAQITYAEDDVLVFGAERAGLDESILGRFPTDRRIVIPMRPGNRSLNLANAVAVVVYEGWRQHGFVGAASTPAEHGLTSETPGAQPFDQ